VDLNFHLEGPIGLTGFLQFLFYLFEACCGRARILSLPYSSGP
jgi:hypothetical protein